MASVHWKINEPFITKKLSLRNRIVMPPMLTTYATKDGAVSDRMLDYYMTRAKGGVGVIIVEASFIDNRCSKFREHQLGIYSDKLLPGLTRLSTVIKSNGAVAICQLCHAGRATFRSIVGAQPVAPSQIPFGDELPQELTVDCLVRIQDTFAEAARRAKEAGFDGVELHGAHGYLLTQFISPLYNKRTDAYGGNLNNRARFALETIKKLKASVGEDFIVGYRTNCHDDIKGGVFSPLSQEVVDFAAMLENAGIDYIHLTGGTIDQPQYTVQPMYIEEACYVACAGQVKRALKKVPLIVAGSLTVTSAEKVLTEGKADLVAFGRSLIADPELPNKIAKGLVSDIRPCIRGNLGCLSNIRRSLGIACEVNPVVGREAQFDIKPARIKKNVVVIGGGIAGMEAARNASARGHRVTLIERESDLGGHLIEASVPEFKKATKRLLNWGINQLVKSSVQVLLKTEASPNLIERLKPDVLIVAVGSEYDTALISKMHATCALKPDEVLLGKKEIQRKVVVIGGGLIGCEIALYMASELRKEVVIIEKMMGILNEEVGANIPEALIEKLDWAGVKIELGLDCKEISDNRVICSNKQGQVRVMAADTAVIATGLLPRKDQAEIFAVLAPEVYRIGDCAETRNISNCFKDAWLVANKI